jgi:hypothetical protein
MFVRAAECGSADPRTVTSGGCPLNRYGDIRQPIPVRSSSGGLDGIETQLEIVQIQAVVDAVVCDRPSPFPSARLS